MYFLSRFSIAVLLVSTTALSGCLSKSGKTATTLPSTGGGTVHACTRTFVAPIPTGSTGEADVYLVDPAASAGDVSISPGSATLGNYTTRVTLEHLTGDGVLKGAYVEVVSGYCAEKPGAYDPQNRFIYPYGDGRLAEAMDYYHGDRFRSRLDEAAALVPAAPVKIIANCGIEDNAYYTQDLDEQGNLYDKVCMGLSSRFSLGNFSHDAQVMIHELQHATTGNSYSANDDLNRFYYDDAGSINEGISDFVALLMTEEFIPGTFDFRVFSRWGLGTLIPNQARTVARCPVYDPTYPNCGQFSASANGYSAEENRISFAYPDGLGWPASRNQPGPAYVKNHFVTNRAIEEIHQNGLIAAGVLWDAYVNLQSGLSENAARLRMLKLITETMAALPKPSAVSDLSPVTYPVFGEKLLETAGLLGWSPAERAALQEATDERGLTSAAQLPASWAEKGEGRLQTPGLHVVDSSTTRGQSNGKLNRGDLAAIFFDVKNTAALTAGSVLLDVSIPSNSLIFLDRSNNEGYVHDGRAMIRYGKINGTAIVAALSSSNSTYHVPTGNTYFKTNPQYANAYTMLTPLYVYVPESAATGTISLQVRLKPANGPEAMLTFPVEIHP